MLNVNGGPNGVNGAQTWGDSNCCGVRARQARLDSRVVRIAE